MIEISDLTVRFGGVAPIDGMTVTFGVGTNGLIGPNGAGKTTFFNVLSGFVRPARAPSPRSATTCWRCPTSSASRWGLRRTFQTEQAIANLSVYENVLMVHEHSGNAASTRRSDVVEAVEFVGLGSGSATSSARSAPPSAGSSRWPGRSSVRRSSSCSTSPRPGCPMTRRQRSARSSSRSPTAPALVILVDHDMDLVSVTCGHVTVLDFGIVIADGETKAVLNDPNVMQAYLGIEEVI